MPHANARLTPAGSLTVVQRIAAGRPIAHVAAEMGVSRQSASRWWRRFRVEGPAGLVERSSAVRSHPRHTRACVATRVRIVRMLTRRGVGHDQSAGRGAGSTVGRVLARHAVPRLADSDPRLA